MSATSNRTALYIVDEVTFGVTPATPALEAIRMTGESINLNNVTEVSNEIRPDRNRSDVIRVDGDVSGSIEFELSMASFDTLLQSVLGGTWSAPVANVSTLKNGSVKRFHSIQKQINDADVAFFQTFVGCAITGFELSVTPSEFVTGSFTVMGKGQSNSNTQIAGATLGVPTTTPIIVGSSEVNSITEDAVESTEIISSLSISVENNPRMTKGIASFGPSDINMGSFDVTGNIEIYFKDAVAYNRMANATKFALAVKLQDTAGDYYTFTMPKVTIISGELVAGGLDTDMMFSGEYRATYDSVSGCTLQITRFNAP
jgi:hypothetical protein